MATDRENAEAALRVLGATCEAECACGCGSSSWWKGDVNFSVIWKKSIAEMRFAIADAPALFAGPVLTTAEAATGPGAIPVAKIEQGVRNALSDPFLFPKQVGQLTVADERMVNLWTEKVMNRVTGTFPPKTGEEAAKS